MTKREFVKGLIANIKYEDGQDTTVVFHRPYTYVGIRFYLENGTKYLEGHGFAKVCYPDKWDRQRGYEIALAKAAQHVGDQLMLSTDARTIRKEWNLVEI